MTNNSKYDWELFWLFANNLLESSEVEESDDIKCTKARVAISRAYYAVYHVAFEFLEKNNFSSVSCGGTHEKVYSTFIEINKRTKDFQSKCHKVGNNLLILKKERQKADYDNNVSITTANAKLDCKKAKKIIDDIKALYIKE